MGQYAQAVEQVPVEHGVDVAYRGQVVGPVPLVELLQVSQQLLRLVFGNGQAQLGNARRQPGLQGFAHEAWEVSRCSSPRFFR